MSDALSTRPFTETAPQAAVADVTVRVLRAVTAFVRRTHEIGPDEIDYVPVVTLEVERAGAQARVQLRPGQMVEAAGCQLRLDAMTDIALGDGEQSAVDVSIWP